MKDNRDGEGVEKKGGARYSALEEGFLGVEVALSWRIEGGASATSDKTDK